MASKIIAVGKKHEPWVEAGILRYETRLKRPFLTEWVLLPHSAREGLAARQDESERILARLKQDDYVVLLDERGKLVDSPSLARLLLRPLEMSKTVVIVIGGAYGVDETIHKRADIVWSLSPLVFPHQLVRLILAEQLYRSQEIAAGHPYHHE
jgi:23S rRNA (pseudouridine1915-N3)-methyltransferase